jgi:hypothetical protein
MAQGGITNLDGQSQYYTVIIDSIRHGMVFAWLPDEFNMNIVENWNFVAGAGLPTIVNFFAEALRGSRPTNQYLTAQIWSGSSPLRFALPLHFVARRDSISEVINPIKILLKAALPVATGGLGSSLIPPGPSISSIAGDALSSIVGQVRSGGFGDEITVYIGSYLRLPQTFIEAVDVSFKGKLDVNGYPMEASATVRFCTLYAPVAGDIDDYLSPGVADPGWRPGTTAQVLAF